MCGSMKDTFNPIIEMIDPSTLNYLWSTYLPEDSDGNYDTFEAVKFHPNGA